MRIRSTAFRVAALTALVLVACVAAAPAAFATTDLTWTGNANDPFWSQGSNWKGGVAPTTDEAIGTLSFGNLGTACNDEDSLFGDLLSHSASDEFPGTCYTGENDIAGLSANEIDINDNVFYTMLGGTLTLGAGGIDATPGASSNAIGLRAAHTNTRAEKDGLGRYLPDNPLLARQSRFLEPRSLQPHKATEKFGFPVSLEMPLVLSAAQSWTINGSKNESDQGLVVSSATGDFPLSLNFTDSTVLGVDGNIQTGAITISGKGEVEPLVSINGVSGNPVTLEDDADLGFSSPGATSGPVEVQSGSGLAVADAIPPEATLAVNGALTLDAGAKTLLFIDQSGDKPSTDYSQITASGNVNLTGSKLDLYQGFTAGFSCQSLHAGDVDTLVSTTGTLTGTFADVANGAVVKIRNICNGATTDATAVINYTTNAVTATIKNPGSASYVPVETGQPKFSGKRVEGHTLTVSQGKWRNKPTSYKYVWQRCSFYTGTCKTIHGTKGHSYKLTAADVGKAIGAEVIVKNKSGTSLAEAFTNRIKAPRPPRSSK